MSPSVEVKKIAPFNGKGSLHHTEEDEDQKVSNEWSCSIEVEVDINIFNIDVKDLTLNI